MGTVTLLILLGIPVLVVVWGIVAYNRLVALRQAVAGSWSQIDVQLKRRKDLVPNLVNAVKGYMAHERGVLDAVTEARAKALQAGPVPTEASLKAEGELGAALSRLMSVVESYPDLKASTNVRDLMEEVTSTENRIAAARQGYNDVVETFNARIESVPDVFVNNLLLRASPATFWRVEEGERTALEAQAPAVEF